MGEPGIPFYCIFLLFWGDNTCLSSVMPFCSTETRGFFRELDDFLAKSPWPINISVPCFILLSKLLFYPNYSFIIQISVKR